MFVLNQCPLAPPMFDITSLVVTAFSGHTSDKLLGLFNAPIRLTLWVGREPTTDLEHWHGLAFFKVQCQLSVAHQCWAPELLVLSFVVNLPTHFARMPCKCGFQLYALLWPFWPRPYWPQSVRAIFALHWVVAVGRKSVWFNRVCWMK